MEMEEERILSLELKHRVAANGRNYYEDLFVPANDAEITDIKQRLRCLWGEEPEATVLGCSLVPELTEIRTVGTLLEYNALAKRLAFIPDEECRAFQALLAKALAEGKYEMPVRDLINMTYGLDKIMTVSNVYTDEMLGAFAIENEMNDAVNGLPDDVIALLDRSAVGMLQRKSDNGFYCFRNYYVLGDYEIPVVYDGIHLPQELMPDHVSFGIDGNGVIHSPISYLNRLSVRTPDDAENLQRLGEIWDNMDSGPQVVLKAILESEQPTCLADCILLSGCLKNFEFSYFSDENDAFAKEYLAFHLPENFQSEALQKANLYDLGTELLKRMGATVTDYGVISESDGALFEKYTDATEEAMGTTKFDVIEIQGQKGLFTNWRLNAREIPDGCYCYDLRSDDGSPFGTLEPKVFVDYSGSVLVKEPIDFGEDGYLTISDDDAPNFLGEDMTVDEFMKADFSEEEGMGMQL